MSKREYAMALFEKGYNCTQSVVGSFCEEAGLDFDSAMKLVSAFGGGMGRLREVCGAVSGMFFITGCLYGYDSPKDIEAKKELYKKVQHLGSEFKSKNGSYVCRELLGLSLKGADCPTPEARTEEYYKKRPCKELIGDAAEILENYIRENPYEK